MATAQTVIEAARHEPNVFMEYVLDVQQAHIHERIQDHYTEHQEAGVGVHRGVGKTTQTLGRVAWEIGHELRVAKIEGRSADIRIKYIQANDSEGHKSVDAVRRVVESARYKHVFPEVKQDATLWGKKAFRVLTGSLQRDPTVEGCGIFGHAGGRATLQIFDDICDLENAVRKAGLRGQVKDAYHNTWRKMLTGEKPRVWCVFTPWHVDDITAEWRKDLGDIGALLWAPCVGHKALFGWTEDQLEAEEARNPIAFARAFKLEPLSAEVLIFPEHWMREAFYTDVPKDPMGHWAQTLDFAFTEKRMIKTGGGDPDWSVALVGFMDHRGHAYLHDMVRCRVEFPVFKAKAFDQGRQYKVRRARGEAVAGQRGLVQQMNMEAPYPIEGVNRISDKVFRATALQSYVSSGRCHIRAVPRNGQLEPIGSLDALFNEMVVFPAGGHDDTVDAALDFMDMARLNVRKPGRGKPKPVKHVEPRAKRLYTIRPQREPPKGRR